MIQDTGQLTIQKKGKGKQESAWNKKKKKKKEALQEKRAHGTVRSNTAAVTKRVSNVRAAEKGNNNRIHKKEDLKRKRQVDSTFFFFFAVVISLHSAAWSKKGGRRLSPRATLLEAIQVADPPYTRTRTDTQRTRSYRNTGGFRYRARRNKTWNQKLQRIHELVYINTFITVNDKVFKTEGKRKQRTEKKRVLLCSPLTLDR